MTNRFRLPGGSHGRYGTHGACTAHGAQQDASHQLCRRSDRWTAPAASIAEMVRSGRLRSRLNNLDVDVVPLVSTTIG